MEFLLFLLLGMGVGVFGTLVGIGGGIILGTIFNFINSRLKNFAVSGGRARRGS